MYTTNLGLERPADKHAAEGKGERKIQEPPVVHSLAAHPPQDGESLNDSLAVRVFLGRASVRERCRK